MHVLVVHQFSNRRSKLTTQSINIELLAFSGNPIVNLQLKSSSNNKISVLLLTMRLHSRSKKNTKFQLEDAYIPITMKWLYCIAIFAQGSRRDEPLCRTNHGDRVDLRINRGCRKTICIIRVFGSNVTDNKNTRVVSVSTPPS